MVAWLSCGDTSLVTWAESHDAGGENRLVLFTTVYNGDESLLRHFLCIYLICSCTQCHIL